MSKIAIVGDVHIASNVSSRVDDYFNTCLNKIKEISEENDSIIFLGDLFNTPTIQNNYFVELYNLFTYYKNKGKKFYSIIGNHDIYNEREESLYKSTLGLCEITGLIEIIKPNMPISIGKYNFHTSYVNFNKAKEHIKTLKLNENDILLLHHFFDDQYEGFTYEDIKDIGCKNIFLGHEHSPFPELRKVYKEFTAYRSGSLLRNSSIQYNLERDIFYFVLEDEVKCYKLENVKSAKDIFTQQAYSQENLSKKIFLQNINDVIGKYTNNISTQNKFSISCILTELNTPISSLNYIKSKYESIGERFE